MARSRRNRRPPTEQERRAEFLKRRRTGIGGSDVGAIMGVDQYKDALDVYMDKVTPQEDVDSPAMERGRMLEPVASELYEMRTGRRLRAGKFRRSRTKPFLIGTPDRIISAIGRKPYFERDAPGTLEIKTANRYVMKRMREEGLPKAYLLQLQHYMGLGGHSWGAFAILCSDPWEFRTFTVEFNQDLYDSVTGLLERFWNDHVKAAVAPLPGVKDYGDSDDVTADMAVTIFKPGAELVSWQSNLDLFREAQAMLKLGNAAKEHAKGKLTELMTFGEGIYEGGGARIHWREQKGKRTFQERELRAMQPLDPIAMAALLTEAGMDLDMVEVLFDNARLNLDDFYKTGKPFKTFRMYDSRKEE